MSGFLRAAVAVTAAFIVSSSALAAIEVEGNLATFAWTPSSGPVSYYTVHLARDGGDISETVAAYVSEPRTTIYGGPGETIRVQVVAWGWSGGSLVSSLPSPLSEEVRFVNPAGAAPTPPPPAVGGVAPYDLNGDGRTDLLWRNSRTGEAVVWIMNGASPSSAVQIDPLGSEWNSVGSGDFDGDGQADLLLQSSQSGAYAIWFMSAGSVRDTVQLEGPGRRWNLDAIADFDGDGRADLLWRDQTLFQRQDQSLIWFMVGATASQAALGAPAAGVVACTPDLDGDGRSDVIWSGPDETVAWLMLGSSPWRTGQAGPRMEGSRAIGCGDANGDGFGDVLWYHYSSRTGSLWVMDGDVGMERSFELPQLEAGWVMEISGDFDGDGLANDILVRHAVSGMIEILQLRWNEPLTGFSVVSMTGGPTWGDSEWWIDTP